MTKRTQLDKNATNNLSTESELKNINMKKGELRPKSHKKREENWLDAPACSVRLGTCEKFSRLISDSLNTELHSDRFEFHQASFYSLLYPPLLVG